MMQTRKAKKSIVVLLIILIGVFLPGIKAGAAELTITAQPKNAAVKIGDKASFSIQASGSSLEYQWYYRKSTSDSWKTSGASGNKTNTISFTAKEENSGYQYRCSVKSGSKTVTSDAATLTVKPGITTQPKSTTAGVSEKVKLSVVAEGTSLTYQWYYRDSSSDNWTASGASGNKTAAISFTAKEENSGRQYRCAVSNKNGTTFTNTVKVTVVPGITVQPKNVKASVGDTAAFTVTAAGSSLTYQWYYRASSSDEWTASGASGNKTSTLSFTAREAYSGRQFRCKITGKNGTVYTEAAVLTVVPKITEQPKAVKKALDSSVSFTVTAEGTNLSYQWYYRNDASDTWKKSAAQGSTTAALTFTAKESYSGRQYRCKVSNSYGSIYTEAVTLLVTAKITAQPVSVESAVTLTASFTVEALGTDLTYQWYYRNSSSESWNKCSGTGCNTPTYKITVKEEYDGRQFRCSITNAGGTIYTNTVSLKITKKPVITKQPSDVKTITGYSKTFTVKAVGDDITYQWYYRNSSSDQWTASTSSSANKATLSLTAKDSWNGRQYRCYLKNSYGSVYTNIVTLTVTKVVDSDFMTASSSAVAATKRTSKKGLQLGSTYELLGYEYYDDKGVPVRSNRYNIENVYFHLNVSDLITTSGYGQELYTYDGTTYYYNPYRADGIDGDYFKDNGGRTVTVVLVSSRSIPGLTYETAESAAYYALNSWDSTASANVQTLLDKIAESMGSYVDYWCIGNEVDMPRTYNYMGDNIPIDTYAKNYTKLLRMVYNTMKKKNSDVAVLVPLDQGWTHSGDGHYSSRDLLDLIKSKTASSDFNWGVALHPYAYDLKSADWWNDVEEHGGSVNNSVNTDMYTMDNIEVVTKYIADNYKYNGKRRPILVTEVGFNAYTDGQYNEKLQAAAVAYAYYKAEADDNIDLFIYNALSDAWDPSYNFGLRTTDGTERLSFKVFCWMDVYGAGANVTSSLLSTLGVSSWTALVPSLDMSQFRRQCVFAPMEYSEGYYEDYKLYGNFLYLKGAICTYTGIVKCGSTYYYAERGYADNTYTGTVTVNGHKYYVSSGVVRYRVS